jgi:hypothetical protein
MLLENVLAAVAVGSHKPRVGGALGSGFASEVDRSRSRLVALADKRMYDAKVTRHHIAIQGPPEIL